jgi:hypothetical protein
MLVVYIVYSVVSGLFSLLFSTIIVARGIQTPYLFLYDGGKKYVVSGELSGYGVKGFVSRGNVIFW